ncbi:hypothetical protein ACU4GD_05895 [Cupriavidus basilensis]
MPVAPWTRGRTPSSTAAPSPAPAQPRRAWRHGNVRLAANAIDNARGALRADTSLDADAATLDNTRGEVTSGGTAQLTVGATANTDGLLAANKALGIKGNSLTGDGSLQSNAGDITAILQTDCAITPGRWPRRGISSCPDRGCPGQRRRRYRQ